MRTHIINESAEKKAREDIATRERELEEGQQRCKQADDAGLKSTPPGFIKV